MTAERKSFPMLPGAHWWALREKFKQSIPGVVTDSYLVLAAYRYAATYLSTFKSPPVRHADTFQYYLSTYLANVSDMRNS
jgi:hypothetical protein